ncbi:MAG: AAA family ATPase [Thermodesulfobacteriota bacterium]
MCLEVKMSDEAQFQSVDEVIQRLAAQRYVCSREIAVTVFLADKMCKPILVEGPAGVGKTELAKAIAGALNQELIRLQCYEGLDENKALYEWAYAKQLLYTQLLREKIGELLAGAGSLSDALGRLLGQEDLFFSESFLLPRPLLKAIRSEAPTVLLVDEVDKAEPEFEAFLLEVLSDFQVSVPELGTLRAKHIPRVILTSNDTREIADTLRRRCLHLYIDYPGAEQERQIVRTRVPELADRLLGQVVAFVQNLRKMDVRKAPSIGETIDWARALVVLNVEELEASLVEETLSLILKHQEDLRRVRPDLHRLTRQAVAC